MLDILLSIFAALPCTLRTRASLQLEILALRHLLVVLQKNNKKRIRLSPSDRIFWVFLSRLWPRLCSCLLLVKPATVIAWHRRGFRLYWKWKNRGTRIGRPGVPKEIRDLINYYHESRCHLSLWKDSPDGRPLQPPEMGKIIALPKVGGLHHRYERSAA